MKLIFYQYILQQEENSLSFRFFIAQQKNPEEEIGTLKYNNEIQSIPPNIFKNLLKKKALLAKQNKCEKGVGIRYESLDLQNYLNSYSNIN